MIMSSNQDSISLTLMNVAQSLFQVIFDSSSTQENDSDAAEKILIGDLLDSFSDSLQMMIDNSMVIRELKPTNISNQVKKCRLFRSTTSISYYTAVLLSVA